MEKLAAAAIEHEPGPAASASVRMAVVPEPTAVAEQLPNPVIGVIVGVPNVKPLGQLVVIVEPATSAPVALGVKPIVQREIALDRKRGGPEAH